MEIFSYFFSYFLDFLFPKSDLAYSLESLGAGELVQKLPPASDLGEHVLAIWNYADPRVRELIWELKYRKNSVIAKHLAEVLFDVVHQELAASFPFPNLVSAVWKGASTRRKL
ncbi:hypothetical protein KW785_03455 [Candidatus Parcubacteria bacterium]|nr:hypothetical protein [Candidatus Parcubacteria bacterium]